MMPVTLGLIVWSFLSAHTGESSVFAYFNELFTIDESTLIEKNSRDDTQATETQGVQFKTIDIGAALRASRTMTAAVAPPPANPRPRASSLQQILRASTDKNTFEAFEHFSVHNKSFDLTQNVRHSESFQSEQHVPDTTEYYVTIPHPDGDSSHEPLNVVIFYADDWTMKVLGKLNPQVRTPNIDLMADNGMLFTQNSVTTSFCGISRATMQTGVYSAVHNQTLVSSEELFTRLPWNDTLFPLLKRNGYYTALVGKWHAPQPSKYLKSAFDYSRFYYGLHWETRNDVLRHVTDLNQEDALEVLRNRPSDQNFALKVSFFATHAEDGSYPSYNPMNESLTMYVDDVIPKPRTNTEKHWNDMPNFFHYATVGRNRYRRRWDTDEEYDRSIRSLYRMATEVDSAVGAIIEELKAQGVYNKTMLIFTTDNGNLHGEHGLSEKWVPFEESVKVPLVIVDPRMPTNQKGKRNEEFTLNVDLAPTILSAAKIEVPSFMQGRDIAQLYFDPDTAKSWRKDFFYEWDQGPQHARTVNPVVFALM